MALLVESDTAQHALEPINGIRDGMAGARIGIIETMVDGDECQAAAETAQKLPVTHPDLVGMVGLYS